ncbi:hypothetical protein HNP84_000861 [Thermocatellispora tengchongensis]|uniref:Glycosyltransferase family 2 protein n=1 Tax=Thermocatellispora tengchongensis TaxID=1073253 RepID=A0A840P542_9ACTN|nr:hypothetical protein [Thermocatellispora tengchongensis]MBB5131155.1 hypothetical protein [Thermocatellispora tengchongensis]
MIALSRCVALAKRLATDLVVLCSRWADAEKALVVARRGGVNVLAVDVPEAQRVELPEFATTALLAGTKFEWRTDTSLKRNIGLALARMRGWDRIVFLDDDIEVRDPDDLVRAAGLLNLYEAVGLFIGGMPDNSVVCHANRYVGNSQDTFVGGGALVVDPVRVTSFFPQIYNEDWFYLLDRARLRRVATVGLAVQAPYDPFAWPGRARTEEFGDVLAEGLFALLHTGGTVREADRVYWAEFLGVRRSFIKGVLSRVEARAQGVEDERIAASLRVALARLWLIDPGLCQDYLEAWQADRSAWRRYVRRLPVGVSTTDALRVLGLDRWFVDRNLSSPDREPALGW